MRMRQVLSDGWHVREVHAGLDIAQRRNLTQTLANLYGSLGGLAEQRGDRARAREHWQKSLDFAQRAGMVQRLAQVKQWLDDLDKPPAP